MMTITFAREEALLREENAIRRPKEPYKLVGCEKL